MQIPAQYIVLFGGSYIHHVNKYNIKYMYYFSDGIIHVA